jgi:DivIVA domain-containing protein
LEKREPMTTHEPRPTFALVMRGYNRSEVDDYLARLSDDPNLAVPAFRLGMRGYDRRQVDEYIEELKSGVAPEGAAPVDIARLLANLVKIRDAGLLSPEEFEQAKAKALGYQAHSERDR